MRYAIIDTATGKVINVVEYDTAPSNPPPGFGAGIIAVQSDVADTNWTWDGSQLVAPTPAAPPAPLEKFSGEEIIEQLSITDCSAIRTQMATDTELWRFWGWLAATGDTMEMDDPILTSGWARLAAAIGVTRANEIATTLSMPSLILPSS